MHKRKASLFLLVLFILLYSVGFAGAADTTDVVTIVTESPLEIEEGKKFSVSVQVNLLEDNFGVKGQKITFQLIAYSDKGSEIAKSAEINDMKIGEERKIILYGKINKDGPTDISKIEFIIKGQDSKTFRVDAFPIQVLDDEDDEEKPEALGTPRVLLQNYTLSESSILAGDIFTLTLYVQNTSTREVRNLKISLATIPAEDGTSGTVFSPVNSSNSFYVERIGAKSTYTKSITIFVDPNATTKTYLVPVEILYEDDRGESYTVSEMVNIPVLQESRLQVLGVEVPPTAIVGEATPVTAEFVNVGKVALKNVLVTVEGDFLKENASYFLATFEIGQSDFYQAYIIPEAEGLLEGKVTFRYLDYTNQEVVEEYPFSIEVMAGLLEPGLPEEPLPENPPSSIPRFLYILGPVLLLALVAAGIVLWRRRKAKQGEIFNEEL